MSWCTLQGADVWQGDDGRVSHPAARQLHADRRAQHFGVVAPRAPLHRRLHEPRQLQRTCERVCVLL